MSAITRFYKSIRGVSAAYAQRAFSDLLPFIAGGVTLMAARSLSWPLLSCAALERGPRLRGDSGATNGERIYRILLSVMCGRETSVGLGRENSVSNPAGGRENSVDKPRLSLPCG